MNVTDPQKALIRESFSRIAPISDLAAELFYARLFAIAPEVQPLFKSDMGEQRVKLMETLAVVIDALDAPETLTAQAHDLARRHVGYGVRAEHYPPVGEALIFTLEHALADDFTPETQTAWQAVYTQLSTLMISSAYARGAVASGVAAE